MIRVSVIASSPILRSGLEALLAEDSRFALVGDSTTRSPARDSGPDVVLMVMVDSDRRVRLPTHLRDDVPPAVLLADHLGRTEMRRLLHSGVRAILPRDATGPEIIAAIEAVAAGLLVLSSTEIETLLPGEVEPMSAEPLPGEALSPRELEVLAMMAEGLVNKDIAARLKISEHTVKFHVSSILGKLNATTRGEAVARGVREGLVVI